MISVHTGLGPLNAATGKFANANVVNSSVLGQLNEDAIVLNYDRGECVDTIALDQAMGLCDLVHGNRSRRIENH